MEIFRTRLKELIKRKGISPAKLAKEMGKGESAVKDIIYGRSRSPGIEMVSSIARELNSTDAYLIGESNDPNTASFTANKTDIDSKLMIDAYDTLEAILDAEDLEMASKQKIETTLAIYRILELKRSKGEEGKVDQEEYQEMIRLIVNNG